MIPFSHPRPAPLFRRRYPWDVWFHRGTFTVVKGRDFNGRIDTFANQVRNTACARGMACSIRISPDGRSLTATVSPLKE